MTKQEEIREGIKKVISDYFGLDVVQEPFLNELPDLMVQYLHSQGCVLKVDRELPSISWSSSDPRYDQAYSKGVANGIRLAEEVGWTATESLVEE